MINNFLKWLVLSSQNPENVALTIRGIIILSLPTIVALLNAGGVNVLEGDLAQKIILGTALFGAFLAILGLVRKIYNTVTDSNVVVFKAKKK